MIIDIVEPESNERVRRRIMVDENGKMMGPALKWRNNERSSFEEYRNGVVHGRSIYWYSPGIHLYHFANYRNGSLHGRKTIYWINGRKNEEIHFKNGKRHGRYTRWSVFGRVEEEMYYSNDNLSWYTVWSLVKNTFGLHPKPSPPPNSNFLF